ncbi:23S rRNA (adenine(2503)-C(2))-methyltransferase RlmN [bacterium]|nr:23S rRNA (adenine(2503)-C(2))-methyltransferase RlmN [bacterium]
MQEMTDKPALRGMDLAAMGGLLAEGGFETYRARQLYQWVFRNGAESIDEMGNLPKPMRAFLAERTTIGGVELVRENGPRGGTQKLLMRTHDGKFIESVVMRDEGAGRTSLCVSSQIGCAVGCAFCLTGFGGFQRNLRTDEIVGQVLAVKRHVLAEDEPLAHVVFMGMGEPMLNLGAVVPALRLLIDPDGVGLSRRRVTVSTAGIVPGIEKFGKEEVGVGLAVSLNATTDETRSEIMPINKKWGIKELIGAIEKFPMEARRRVTIEYVLLKGINDTVDDAERLVRLLRKLPVKVNLIMFNASPQLPFKPADEERLEMFAAVLSRSNMTVTVRWSKGREIEAACGQLAAHYFEKSAES